MLDNSAYCGIIHHWANPPADPIHSLGGPSPNGRKNIRSGFYRCPTQTSQYSYFETLSIEQLTFTETNGNVQGYARKRQVAINPVAQLPIKTLFHEAAHVMLGHTAETDVSL